MCKKYARRNGNVQWKHQPVHRRTSVDCSKILVNMHSQKNNNVDWQCWLLADVLIEVEYTHIVDNSSNKISMISFMRNIKETCFPTTSSRRIIVQWTRKVTLDQDDGCWWYVYEYYDWHKSENEQRRSKVTLYLILWTFSLFLLCCCCWLQVMVWFWHMLCGKTRIVFHISYFRHKRHNFPWKWVQFLLMFFT